jgi:hypothetical protein
MSTAPTPPLEQQSRRAAGKPQTGGTIVLALAGQAAILAALLVWHVGVPTLLRAATTPVNPTAPTAQQVPPLRASTTPSTPANFTTASTSSSPLPLVKQKDLHLLISITSGPAHTLLRQAARETWLTPCAQSPVCDYRFFVDRLEGNVTDALATENR